MTFLFETFWWLQNNDTRRGRDLVLSGWDGVVGTGSATGDAGIMRGGYVGFVRLVCVPEFLVVSDHTVDPTAD